MENLLETMNEKRFDKATNVGLVAGAGLFYLGMPELINSDFIQGLGIGILAMDVALNAGLYGLESVFLGKNYNKQSN